MNLRKKNYVVKTSLNYAIVIQYIYFSPRNENLNLSVQIKFLNLSLKIWFFFTVLNKVLRFLGRGLVLIVRT